MSDPLPRRTRRPGSPAHLVPSVVEVSPADTIQRIIAGGLLARALDVFVELGCPQQLAIYGEQSAQELAKRVRAQPRQLATILNALLSDSIVNRTEIGHYVLGMTGQTLLADHENTMLPSVRINAHRLWRAAMDELTDTVRTGRAAVTDAHGGLYAYLEAHPETAALFDWYMESRTRRIAPAVARREFGATVVDLGGGTGHLLAAVLRAHRDATGVLVERESVARRARAYLEEQNIGGRWEVLAGDIFHTIPPGTDYVLASVLHNLDDARAGSLLAAVRDTMTADSRLWLIDMLTPGGSEPHPAHAIALRMLGLFATTERTVQQYTDLLTGAGLWPDRRMQSLPWGLSLITCTIAPPPAGS
ncbi:methyltransferase [Sphaerisporangium flaviroseum]|uniref:Methyltransferase n=1 Tax=Sphaerisporangium flaviroseum TaxID=509199 RepID=A0ABP7JGS5_9ACTN